MALHHGVGVSTALGPMGRFHSEAEKESKERDKTLQSLAFTLNHIFLQDRTIRTYSIEEKEMMMVAEDAIEYSNNE